MSHEQTAIKESICDYLKGDFPYGCEINDKKYLQLHQQPMQIQHYYRHIPALTLAYWGDSITLLRSNVSHQNHADMNTKPCGAPNLCPSSLPEVQSIILIEIRTELSSK